MPHNRPVSDLRNNFADISRTVHETREPVFLTKNGYGDMVVMSLEAYEQKQFESEIYFKL
ncbi:type II toxin-antitoxin system Phd/YefM family antitoxin [Oceanobacillus halophilus]|uniref:type II toxin-antitoxin system Phd/YefM family antitoxin n=1 Tax=Oceanobacillus halophilus TaxID=930130 RepID=UPI0019D4D976|nr:type II toxin-antitoxin system Phd/YefM family antitoxin [Oceanobacillus halophilus]